MRARQTEMKPSSAVVATVVLLGAALSSCTDSDAHGEASDLPPSTASASGEFAATGGAVCPHEQPLSDASDGFGTTEPAVASPEFRRVKQAWVCEYRPRLGKPGLNAQGRYV